MAVTRPDSARASVRSRRRWFWVFASLGLVAMTVAWVWFGMAQEEAQSEQGKALSAGATMAGFGEVVGGVPLVLAHLVGLAILIPLAWMGWTPLKGLFFGCAAVAVVSAFGIGVGQILWAGELFELGIDHSSFVP